MAIPDGSSAASASGFQCVVCGHALRPGYRLRGGETRCLRHAVRHPAVVRRAFVTALIVGTVLTTINQGDRILVGDVTPVVLAKAVLTFCVPFAVSTSGALGAARMTPELPEHR